jgi:diaminopimelate decarboxylase
VLDVVAVHAHRGGMIRSESELTRFAGAVMTFADEVERSCGCRFEILNFGGSLGLATVAGLDSRDRKLNQALHRDMPLPHGEGVPDIARYVQVLLEQVEGHYRGSGRARPRVFVEPGRAMTADTQMLLASVMTTKDQGEVKFAILDAGINLAESVRAEYHQLFALNRFGEPARRVHTIVGPICSPGDTLYAAARLPELVAGDSVAIMDAGAYFVPFSTSFSFPRPAVVMVDGDDVQVLRRRETFDDLVSRDTGCGSAQP